MNKVDVYKFKVINVITSKETNIQIKAYANNEYFIY